MPAQNVSSPARPRKEQLSRDVKHSRDRRISVQALNWGYRQVKQEEEAEGCEGLDVLSRAWVVIAICAVKILSLKTSWCNAVRMFMHVFVHSAR